MGENIFEGRELGWDDTIQKESSEFEPLPEGDYDFMVESLTAAVTMAAKSFRPAIKQC